jgi:hypothetical protein
MFMSDNDFPDDDDLQLEEIVADDSNSRSKSGPGAVNTGGYGRHGANPAGGDRPSTSGGYENENSFSNSRPATSGGAGLGSAGALPSDSSGQNRAKMLQQQRELHKKKAAERMGAGMMRSAGQNSPSRESQSTRAPPSFSAPRPMTADKERSQFYDDRERGNGGGYR